MLSGVKNHAEDYKRNVGTVWTNISATQHGDGMNITVAPMFVNLRRSSFAVLPARLPAARISTALPG